MRCHVSPRYDMNDTRSDCTPKMQKNGIRINILETFFFSLSFGVQGLGKWTGVQLGTLISFFLFSFTGRYGRFWAYSSFTEI